MTPDIGTSGQQQIGVEEADMHGGSEYLHLSLIPSHKHASNIRLFLQHMKYIKCSILQMPLDLTTFLPLLYVCSSGIFAPHARQNKTERGH
jgi:hypothetical protein